MYNSCTSVFRNTSAWKQQGVNNTKEAAEEDMKRSVNVELSEAGIKKRSPDGLTVARAYSLIVLATPQSSG